MGIEAPRFTPQAEGNIEEFEGDVVVPDEPDSIGWNRERYDHGDKSDYVMISASRMARSILEHNVVEPMLLDQAEIDDEAQGEGEVDRDVMKLNVRITMAKERFGFKPTTHEELNRFMGIASEDLISGSATHVSRIQRRNVTKNKEAVVATKDLPAEERVELDPTVSRRTAEKIVSQYVSYADSALHERRLLLGLQDMLSSGYSRKEPARAVSILREWTMDASTSVPIKGLMKSAATEAYIIDDTDKKSPLQIDYSKLRSTEVRALGDAYINDLKVGQLQDQIASFAREQECRFAFWTNALKEVLPNSAARDSALTALKKFKLL